MSLFGRVYKLVIGQAGTQAGFEITEMRISFLIQKTLSRNPNKNSVKVWNLSPNTRAKLEMPDTRCFLYAGYEEESGPLLIFQGNVTFAFSVYDGADVITEFELGDGEIEYRNTTVSIGYSNGTNARSIITDIARQMGLPLYIGSNVPEYSFPHGYSYYGAARNALTRVTRAAGLQWSIQNGLLQVVLAGGSTNRQAIVLSAESGLLGNPERERQSAAETARVRNQTTGQSANIVSAARQYDGWRVKSLLMPTVVAGDQVKLESRTATDTYIAAEVHHRGDTHEGDWQTEFKLVDTATAARIRQEEAQRQANETRRNATARNPAAPTPPSSP